MSPEVIGGWMREVGALSHALAGIAFLLLSVILVVGWTRGRRNPWLLAACMVTAIWAWAAGSVHLAPHIMLPVVLILDVARSAVWMAFLFSLVAPMWRQTQRTTTLAFLTAAVGALCVFVIANDLVAVGRGSAAPALAETSWALAGLVARLLIAVAGLLWVENLFLNIRLDHRSAVRPLCVGLGGMFAYDFFMYSHALLFKLVDQDLIDARGLISAAVVPFIVVFIRRDPDRSLNLIVSRQTVFRTATLVGAGAYLLLMWAVAFYLRRFGGMWGPLLQVAFLSAAFVVLLSVLFSGNFRAWLKIVISKHFFLYRYDYRDEWLRLIGTISTSASASSLPERVIQGIADIVESPEGVLWVLVDGERFEPMAAWNAPLPDDSYAADPALVAFFETSNWIVDLEDLSRRPGFYKGLNVPEWLRVTRRPWLLAPLMHHERLFGIVTLNRSRAPRSLDWEDYDLLKTVGRQAANYLAEQYAAQALAEARQFEEFNRRFAFVLHDIKNLVSQLTLLLSNTKKHQGDPRFQKDMIDTIQESVTKMNHLLVRLRQGGHEAMVASAVDLSRFLPRIVDRNARPTGNLVFEPGPETLAVLADEERLSAVVSHLIDNALDAIPRDGLVSVRLTRDGDDAVIAIEDDGMGMDADFIREKLFQPFRSTKEGGYGIGAYESREYVRELGGRIDVTSQPGHGTTVRISLPTVSRDSSVPALEDRGGG